MKNRHPLFVYGTLRRGQPNYTVLRGFTVREEAAQIDSMSLFSLGTYPIMVPGDDTVLGELLTLNPRLYGQLLSTLDELEGVDHAGEDSRFRRVLRAVQTAAGQTVSAWLYLGQSVLANGNYQRIVHGDWVRFQEERTMKTCLNKPIDSHATQAKG